MSSIVNFALSTLFPHREHQAHKSQNQSPSGLTRATTAPELSVPRVYSSHVPSKTTAPTLPMAIPGHVADDTSGGSPSSMVSHSPKSLMVSAAKRYFDDPRFYPH